MLSLTSAGWSWDAKKASIIVALNHLQEENNNCVKDLEAIVAPACHRSVLTKVQFDVGELVLVPVTNCTHIFHQCCKLGAPERNCAHQVWSLFPEPPKPE